MIEETNRLPKIKTSSGNLGIIEAKNLCIIGDSGVGRLIAEALAANCTDAQKKVIKLSKSDIVIVDGGIDKTPTIGISNPFNGIISKVRITSIPLLTCTQPCPEPRLKTKDNWKPQKYQNGIRKHRS